MSTRSSSASSALDEADGGAAAAVQPHGFAMLLSAEWLVEQASANLRSFFGTSGSEAVGQSLAAILGGDAVHSLRNTLSQSGGGDAGLFGCPVDGTTFDFLLRAVGRRTLVEGCQSDNAERGDRIAIVLAALDRLPEGDEAALAKGIVREMRALSGFDRVLLCADGGGAPIEQGSRTLSRHIGPVSVATWLPSGSDVRLIADSNAPPVPLHPARPLDAIFSAPDSGVRDAMRDAGAKAALAIRRPGGLLLCQHPEPRALSLPLLSALRLFARLAGERLAVASA